MSKQDTTFVRWNAMLIAMADGKAILNSSWMSYTICERMWQMLHHILLRLCILCNLVTRMLYCPIILCIALPALSTLGLPAHGY